MDYNFCATSKEDIKNVFPSYFDYYSRLYGNSIFTDVCRKFVARGKYDSKTLIMVDPAYSYTNGTVNASNNDGVKIIAMKDDEQNDVGYFRMRNITINKEKITAIAEVVIANSIQGDRVDILKELIPSIEKLATENATAEKLDFEAAVKDIEMQTALVELGFHPLISENDGDKFTFVYEKSLRELKTTRK